MAMPIWLAGIVGGLIAGAVMAGCLSAIAPYRGFGEFATPARLTAATVEGRDALDGGARSVLLGGGLHFAVSAILGVIFAVLMAVFGLTHLDVAARAGIFLGAGMLYGSFIYGVSALLVLPIVNRWMVRRLPIVDFGAVHVIFGAILGWTLLIFT